MREVHDPGDLTTVRLGPLGCAVVRDDGAVVYVDGVEVVRSNMPAGAITSTTLASAAVAGAERLPVHLDAQHHLGR